jgi:uncharacterized protein YbjT (DUF2867 family)
MDNMQGTHVVIGANGGIGQALVRELVAQANSNKPSDRSRPLLTRKPSKIQSSGSVLRRRPENKTSLSLLVGAALSGRAPF